MKRSSKVAVAIMFSTALVACGPEPVNVVTAKDIGECASAGMTAGDCVDAYNAASAIHGDVAPKYESKEECEADFGEGKCETSSTPNSSGGSSFMPMMMGFMLGQMMANNSTAMQSANHVSPQPLYQTREGTFTTARGTSIGDSLGVKSMGASSVSAPQKTTTMSRGGFGGRAGGFSSGG